MAEMYAKILKKFNTNGDLVSSIHFFEDQGFSKGTNYFNVMESLSNQGYSQIIINSELIISITGSMLKNKWVLFDVELDDPEMIDETIKDQIHLFTENVRRNSEDFERNVEFLDWILERESILISKISLVTSDTYQRMFITRTGLVFGDKQVIENSFENSIKLVIDKYLEAP